AAVVIAATAPDVSPPFKARLPFPIAPVGPADRVLAPVLAVAELLSWGAAFTSLGLLLATWTPRIGRALGISVAVFLLLSIGWVVLCGSVILPQLHVWASAHYNTDGGALVWIDQALIGFSPMAAPITTIQVLNYPFAGRSQFWAIMAFWSLLAWA